MVSIDSRPSNNYWQGRPYGEPNLIVIHHWGADGQSHDAVANYLARPNGNTSAHYVVSGNRITQLVDENNRAWHAGTYGNRRGIGIECRPEMDTETVKTVKWLIADIERRRGRMALVGHRDIMNTACPGRWYAHIQTLREMESAEMDNETRAKIDTMNYAIGHIILPVLTRMDTFRVQTMAEIAGMKTVLGKLADSEDIENVDIEKAINDSVAKAMENIEITLTSRKGEE